jgi:hypothetical protein
MHHYVISGSNHNISRLWLRLHDSDEAPLPPKGLDFRTTLDKDTRRARTSAFRVGGIGSMLAVSISSR